MIDRSDGVNGVRITLCLPVNKAREQLAALVVISSIKQQFKGITYSQLKRPVFTGYWLGDPTDDPDAIYQDKISLVIVDVKDAPHLQNLRGTLEDLREMVFDAYNKASVPQQRYE